MNITEYAPLPVKPVAPQPKLIVFLGAFFGGVFGLGLALLKHSLQDRITGVYDVETDVGAELLGMIPILKGDKSSERAGRIVATDKFDSVSEAFAGLRTSLISRHGDSDNGWVIALSSHEPGEGKSTVASNLALALSQVHSKVLLVDGDFRRPMVAKVHSIPDDAGVLIEMLSDASSLDYSEVVHQSGDENLYVTVGTPLEGVSPVEVIESDRFAEFMRWARSEFDVVVIDTPPLGVIHDAMVYGRYADDFLLVCRYGKARKAVVRRLLSLLQRNRCRVAGVVLNAYREGAGEAVGGYAMKYGYNYKS